MKGFCTIACGSIEYSILAKNLLISYRRFNSDIPFAVITDKPNTYLEDFDQIIVDTSLEKSFVSKLELFRICPYDETIFIDADSLIYNDLSSLFDYFSSASIVSCLGSVFPRDSEAGWFRYEDIKKDYPEVNMTIMLHGGIYYLRKDARMNEFYSLCKKIEKDYSKYYFRFQYLTKPADEPIIALAMAIEGFTPVFHKPDILAFYRDSRVNKIDIISGALDYSIATGHTDHGMIIHWATANTKKKLYKTEELKIKWLEKKKNAKYKPNISEFIYWKVYSFVKTINELPKSRFFRKY